MTTFLCACLCDQDDGVYLVEPPAFLIKNGFVPSGVCWKLKKALYGLCQAPKRLQHDIDATLGEQAI